jgi:hypothetical protein
MNLDVNYNTCDAPEELQFHGSTNSSSKDAILNHIVGVVNKRTRKKTPLVTAWSPVEQVTKKRSENKNKHRRYASQGMSKRPRWIGD